MNVVNVSDVIASAVPDTAKQAIPKVPTHIRGLDAILHGGLPKGHTTLLSGGPGTGKTLLAMEFLCRSALAGEPGLFISFEERAEDIQANVMSIGLDISSLEKSKKLKVLHFQIPHNAVRAGDFNIQGLLSLIKGNLDALHAATIVLDALDVLMRVFQDPEREREEMYILNDWLQAQSLTAVLTVKSMVQEKQSYSFLDFMADCIISLDQRTTGQVRTRRLTVIKYRGSDFLTNEYPYVISPDGVVLMPVSAVSLDYPAVRKRISTGNALFDKLTGGGYFHGSSILLAGPSGSGKTTMAVTFTRAAANRGEKTLYVSFEESRDVLFSRAKSVGIDLHQDVDADRLRFLSLLPETAGVEQHLLWISDAIDDFDPDHLVVDAISACRRMGSEKAVFDLLLRLIVICRKKQITCLYTNQLEVMDQVTQITGFKISSVVDTLVTLHYVDDGTKLCRRLLVVKFRGSPHSMTYHSFVITERGIDITSSENKGEQAKGQEG